MTRNTETSTEFKTGAAYTMRSVCDHECAWHFYVARRTAHTVTIAEVYDDKNSLGRGSQMCRISRYNGIEQVSPLGKYSMSPILSADRRFEGI